MKPVVVATGHLKRDLNERGQVAARSASLRFAERDRCDVPLSFPLTAMRAVHGQVAQPASLCEVSNDAISAGPVGFPLLIPASAPLSNCTTAPHPGIRLHWSLAAATGKATPRIPRMLLISCCPKLGSSLFGHTSVRPSVLLRHQRRRALARPRLADFMSP